MHKVSLSLQQATATRCFTKRGSFVRPGGRGLPWTLSLLLFLALAQVLQAGSGLAWEWFPSDEEILKYRKSWNPFSHGPMLISSVDVQPKGQWHIRPFFFNQIGEKHYGNRFTLPTERKDGPVHLYSSQHPFLNSDYGITNHIEIGFYTNISTFWARNTAGFNRGEGGPWTTNTGLGDTSIALKWRPIVQDPDTWRPSFTLMGILALPTGVWFTGTETPPGGFSPLGRLPATPFGAINYTQGLLFRKIIRPFRFNFVAFYTHAVPGSSQGTTTYVPDFINTRFGIEHILDDKRGFGYNIEFVGLHGTTWRIDGHATNRGQRSGSQLFGVEPSIQWRVGQTNLVAAVGVAFTLAGQNTSDSIYPNFSLFYFWRGIGKVQMR